MRVNSSIAMVLTLMFFFSGNLFAGSSDGYKLIAGDENQCDCFKDYYNNLCQYYPAIVKSVAEIEGVHLKGEAVKFPDGTMRTPYLLDYNNDGIEEVYFRYDESTHYMMGAALFVVYNHEKLRTDLSNLSISDLHVFPCQYDESDYQSIDCPPFSQNADSAGITVSIDNENVDFWARYTDIRILRKDKVNYLLLHGISHETIDYTAVVKPVGVDSYESVCIFKR